MCAFFGANIRHEIHLRMYYLSIERLCVVRAPLYPYDCKYRGYILPYKWFEQCTVTAYFIRTDRMTKVPSSLLAYHLSTLDQTINVLAERGKRRRRIERNKARDRYSHTSDFIHHKLIKRKGSLRQEVTLVSRCTWYMQKMNLKLDPNPTISNVSLCMHMHI